MKNFQSQNVTEQPEKVDEKICNRIRYLCCWAGNVFKLVVKKMLVMFAYSKKVFFSWYYKQYHHTHTHTHNKSTFLFVPFFPFILPTRYELQKSVFGHSYGKCQAVTESHFHYKRYLILAKGQVKFRWKYMKLTGLPFVWNVLLVLIRSNFQWKLNQCLFWVTNVGNLSFNHEIVCVNFTFYNFKQKALHLCKHLVTEHAQLSLVDTSLQVQGLPCRTNSFH